MHAEIQQILHPGQSVHPEAAEADAFFIARSAKARPGHRAVAETSPVQIDLEAGDRILISHVLPVGAIEREAFQRKALHLQEAAVPEAAQHAVRLQDRRLVDQEINIAGRAQAEIAKNGLSERQAFQNTDRDAAGLKFLDQAPQFGEGAERPMGAVGRFLLQLSQNCLAFRRLRVRHAGTQSVGDQRHEPMVLDQAEKTLPVELASRSLADEFAILLPLRPPCAQQKQIEFGRTIGLPPLGWIRGVVLTILRIPPAPGHRHPRYIRCLRGLKNGSGRPTRDRGIPSPRGYCKAASPCIVQKERI